MREDQGYNDCCIGWPCSPLCNAWVWVSNVVCVLWTWVTTAVCVVWDTVTTVMGALGVTVESTFGWLLAAIGFVVEIIFAIPVLGALLRWVWNFITHIAVGLMYGFGTVDAVLGLIGVRPEKKLRVCTVILRDEGGDAVATVEFAKLILQLAVDVYKRDANVRILPSRPFKYSTGFAGAETVDDSWVTIDSGNSDSGLLDVTCDGGADLLGMGTGFQLKSSTLCFFGSWRRVTGYGGPVSCFIVRSVGDEDEVGCALWITDYAMIEGDDTLPPRSPRVLGHELGHACNLYHLCVRGDERNLMATSNGTPVLSACDPPATQPEPDYANPRMDTLQVISVRLSKHVTYF